MPTFATRPFRNWNSTNLPIHNRFSLENTIQKSSDYLLWCSIGCYVVDQWSGDCWFFRRVKIFPITLLKGFSTFRNAGREDCFSSEQYHAEFPVQEEGQPRGAESTKTGPVSTRNTDRPYDLRLLSSDWRSWYTITVRWFVLCHSSWWQYSGIRYKMGRSSVVYVKSSIRWHLGKCVQSEDTWVCATQNCIRIVRHGNIRRFRFPTFKSWKPWWRAV